jgi:hypothetical protein
MVAEALDALREKLHVTGCGETGHQRYFSVNGVNGRLPRLSEARKKWWKPTSNALVIKA